MSTRIARALLFALMPLAGWVGAQPQPPAVTAAVPATSPDAGAALGRLFYTPAQRAALDEQRRRPQGAVAAEPATAAPAAPEYVTLNGIVRRSDGATTVWLNDRQVRGRETHEGLRITPARPTAPPNHVTVRVPQTGQVVDLKVGQQLEVNSGAVKERYRDPQPAPASAQTPPSTPRAAEATTPRDRRATREREALRELLREIDPPGEPPGSSPPAAAGAPHR